MIPNGKIPSELSVAVSDRWRDFCDALEKADLALPGDAILSDTIKRVFAFSDFVSRSCVQAPYNVSGSDHFPGSVKILSARGI